MNQAIFYFFYNFAHQSAFFDKVVIFIAVYFIYLVIFSALLFLIFYHKILPSHNPIKEFMKKWKEFILLCFYGGIAWGLAKILKILFFTPRPFDVFPPLRPLFIETGYAFPSGHTAVASAVAFALFFTNKKAGYIFMFFAFFIGITRIIAGVHFPVDILGGFILGAFVAFLVKNV